ncbi:MAG: RsmB/NOP family class I SAM-dependent RNA methyltransferase, partial [Pseudomonadota bacterium]
GGGKALALAARGAVQVFAHDAAPERMRDLPDRATRAGAAITCLGTHELARQAPFDVVLCDVPCSGSGAWRRAPDGKWALTRDRLAELCEIQGQILQEASALVQPGGVLVYATCSVLRAENDERVDAFVEEHPSFRPRTLHRWPVTAGVFGTDGFFGAILTRDD